MPDVDHVRNKTMGKVRLQDVARVAGVSMKTVSNVVHDYPHVSAAMRKLSLIHI